MKVEQGIAKFLVQLAADGRSPHTRNQYSRHLRLFAGMFREHRLEEVGVDEVARFFTSPRATRRPDGKSKKPASVNALRTSIRMFFAYLHTAGLVASNPARVLRRAVCPRAIPRALPDADLEKLCAALAGARTRAEKRDRALYLTMLGTGIRVSSAIGLDVRDVDLGAGELRLRRLKGGGEDTVFAPPSVVELLRAEIGGRVRGPVFIGRSGRRLGVRSVHRRLGWWSRRAGLGREVSPHALRHSFAMRVYKRTSDVMVTARALCHRSVASTAVYARPTAEAVRAAVGACHQGART